MQAFEQQDLFVSGQGGYVRYRIPALAVTTTGTVLAFCEARKYTGHDSDQIDLFLRRSEDGGRTFGAVQVVATQHDWVCGNPAPVVDAGTGTVWLLFCRNHRHGDETMICQGWAPRTVWVTHSDDDGATWSEPREITAEVKRTGWSWYATGPGHGIQLGTGRLLIPCDHIVFRDGNRQDPQHSHVVYSDDHGRTWHLGGVASPGTNECTAFEGAAGWLCLNSRNQAQLSEGGNYRAVAWSGDGGLTFSPGVHDAALLEPVCQASTCRLDEAGVGRSRVLFSNPASRIRDHLTVRLSYDQGQTWPLARLLHAGPAAYSDLCVTGEGRICCLYERGREGPYEALSLARFSLEWLSYGTDQL
jgi:sialidase-1